MRRTLIVLALTFAWLPVLAEEKPAPQAASMQGTFIPHFAVGGPQWQTTFVFHNPSSRFEKFYINFLGERGGQPLAIPVLGGLTSSVLVNLGPFATYKLVSDYRPDLPSMSGSAFLGTPDTCPDCYFMYTTVYTIFAMYEPQQRKFLCEATVDQVSEYGHDRLLVYDQDGYVMGVALVNSGLPYYTSTGTVTASVYDKDNQLLRVDTFVMGPLEHIAFVLSDRYPETAGKMGHVRFQMSDGYINGIALRFSPNGTFTSMHMITP
jgi:hypothetical protein